MTVDPRSGTLNIEVGDSGKELQVNSNFARLAALTVGGAKSASTTTPPAIPGDGDVYIVPTGATGVWAGNAGKVAHYTISTGWQFYTPAIGWSLPVIDRGNQIFYYAGASWTKIVLIAATSSKLVAATASISTALGTLFQFDTTEFSGGGITFATNVFTVPSTSKYIFSGVLDLTLVTSGVDASLEIFSKVAGSNADFLGRVLIEVTGTKDSSLSFNRILNLTAGDTVGVSVGTTTNLTTITEKGAGNSWIQLRDIG